MAGETVARDCRRRLFPAPLAARTPCGRDQGGRRRACRPAGVGRRLGRDGAATKGKLVKVYPEIDDGRVIADVEVDGLGDFFVGERTLVWMPVGRAQRSWCSARRRSPPRYGIDYVSIVSGGR